MEAGKLNRRIEVQYRADGQDEFGQPVDTWVSLGKLWASPANETGLAAIRNSTQPGIPSSVARYSFLVRRNAMLSKGVNVGMRILYESLVFDIRLITQDLQDHEKAFLVCEQGGSDG